MRMNERELKLAQICIDAIHVINHIANTQDSLEIAQAGNTLAERLRGVWEYASTS
jgi:hypothetical protein